MLPRADEFAEAAGCLGISADDRIIVYDNSPHHTATRGWFMFRHFGARQVAILDGGFQKWTSEGRPVVSGAVTSPPVRFEASERTDVVSKSELLPDTNSLGMLKP